MATAGNPDVLALKVELAELQRHVARLVGAETPERLAVSQDLIAALGNLQTAMYWIEHALTRR